MSHAAIYLKNDIKLGEEKLRLLNWEAPYPEFEKKLKDIFRFLPDTITENYARIQYDAYHESKKKVYLFYLILFNVLYRLKYR